MEEKSMEFSNRTKAEIERNRFAAQTGALVQLSAPAYREILAAAQKWFAPAGRQEGARPCAYCIGTGQNIMHGHPCQACGGTGAATTSSGAMPAGQDRASAVKEPSGE